MEKVIIPKSGLYKCVLLTNGETTVFRAGDGEFHMDVAKKFRNSEPNLKEFRIVGGGRISIRPRFYDDELHKDPKNVIRVYGYSVDYGRMDKDLVEELLSEYCKDNGLEFINECGQGY